VGVLTGGNVPERSSDLGEEKQPPELGAGTEGERERERERERRRERG